MKFIHNGIRKSNININKCHRILHILKYKYIKIVIKLKLILSNNYKNKSIKIKKYQLNYKKYYN